MIDSALVMFAYDGSGRLNRVVNKWRSVVDVT